MMNKNHFFFLLIIFLCFEACKQKSDHVVLRQEVIQLHDSVMMKNDKVVNLEMKMDTILRNLDSLKRIDPAIDTVALRKEIQPLLHNLQSAEESMNDWMHRFNPDVTGKSKADAILYFEQEKQKLQNIDSLYDIRTKMAGDYLKKLQGQLPKK